MSSKVEVDELTPESPNFRDANLQVQHVFIYPDQNHPAFQVSMGIKLVEHSSLNQVAMTDDDLQSPAGKRLKAEAAAAPAASNGSDSPLVSNATTASNVDVASDAVKESRPSVTSSPQVSAQPAPPVEANHVCTSTASKSSVLPDAFPSQPSQNGLTAQDSKSGGFAPNRMNEATAMKRRHQIIEQMFNRAEALDTPRGRLPPGVKPPRTKFDPEATPNVSAGKRKATDTVSLPRTRPAFESIAYICQGPSTKGKFYKDKAEALGALPGNQFGMLYNGISVTLDDGTVIRPDQVLDPDVPGSIFIVIDCPNASYVGSLTQNQAFVPHFRVNATNQVKVIIHMLGDDVLDHPEYRNWVNEFDNESTQHLIISRKHCPKPIVFTGSAITQYRLNMIDPDVFRVPIYENRMMDLRRADPNLPPLPRWTIPATHLLIYHLNPIAVTDTTEQRPLFHINDTKNGVVHGIHYLRKFIGTSQDVCQQIQESAESVESDYGPGADVMVTMLGTGAALPSRFRNVSSTLISIPNYGHILLDAGEGTYGQIFRRFSQDTSVSIDDILLNLKCIFISHMHADHHLGVIRLLLSRREAFFTRGMAPPPLCIIGPPQYWIWLSEFSDVQDLGLDGKKGIYFIRADLIVQERSNVYNAYLERIKDTLGFNVFSTIPVDHCTYAYALIMQHRDGWKIVWVSGSGAILEALQEPDLLIHESTFEPDHADEAVEKRHCTTGEAVIVAGRMKAKALLLTHFSQRYPRLPYVRDPKNRTAVAFDLMSVKLKQLRRFGMYGPALQDLYPNYEGPPQYNDDIEYGPADEDMDAQQQNGNQTDDTMALESAAVGVGGEEGVVNSGDDGKAAPDE
ncbi:hypothetical protein SmJEL517_g00624 [Synchytrium microbalum]|uniref:ribonuclease Z n=1 Tax=Synchytrium microbalum TaxID=1806994 RepID=A0A507CIK7_9FUNG|nr:uncharacterized protein SmJEL517_g00624 [Synchytrium microbalum]TPX37555.1 hypothetical protein SmJEL517_g00624 [Synchytrium microbalum]